MKLFLHTPEKIRIINGSQEFSCAPTAFAELEPDYPGLPTGKTLRYWTPDYSYVDGDALVNPDPLDCLPYINNMSVYQQTLPTAYMHITLSQTAICVTRDPAETIQVHAAFKPTADPESPSLQVDHEWFIKLRHEDGLAFDSFLAAFVAGECDVAYGYTAGLPLGNWSLQESDFAVVSVGPQAYHVKLANPVNFTLYREL